MLTSHRTSYSEKGILHNLSTKNLGKSTWDEGILAFKKGNKMLLQEYYTCTGEKEIEAFGGLAKWTTKYEWKGRKKRYQAMLNHGQ